MVAPWNRALSEGERQAYLKRVEDFLDSDTTTVEDIASGSDFHDERTQIVSPAFAASVPCSDAELDERIAIAKRIQDAIRSFCDNAKDEEGREYVASFQLNLMGFMAIIVSMDMQELRDHSVSLRPDMLLPAVQATEPLMATCM